MTTSTPNGNLSSQFADLKVSSSSFSHDSGDLDEYDFHDPDVLYSNPGSSRPYEEDNNWTDTVGGGKLGSLRSDSYSNSEGKEGRDGSDAVGRSAKSSSSPHKSKNSGLSLNLNIADAKSGHSNSNSSNNRALELADEHIATQERTVNVVFDFMDGSQGEGTFKLGHSVEFLKSYVESEYGIPIQEQNMYLDDKRMLDPLSLLDYPQEKGADEMFIRVDGELPADSKK